MIRFCHKPLVACLLLLNSCIALAAKEVVIAIYSPVTTLDPYDAHDTISQAVAKSFYEGLFGFDKQLKIRPVLATDYQISEDGLVYTFNLRQGVRFHDGSEFNAETVKINFDRITNRNNKLKRYNLFRNISKTVVTGTYQIQIYLKQPSSALICTLAHPSAVMISPDALQKYQKQINEHPVGTGPFKLQSLDPIGRLTVTKFPDYWQHGLPKVDAIIWEPIIENYERALVMQKGLAHFAYTVPYEYFESLNNDPKLTIVTARSIIQRYIAINMQQKPFDDLRVRQALNYAINKEALINLAFADHAKIANGIVPAEIQFAQHYPSWPYDPHKAKALLSEAGYPDGFKLKLWSGYNGTTAQKVLQLVKQQLREIDIEAEVVALDAKQRVTRVENLTSPSEAEYQLYYSGWAASIPDIDFALSPLLSTSSWPPHMFNNGFYSNPNVDQLLQAASKSHDDQQKAELYKTAQDTAYHDVPWIYLVNDELVYVHNNQLTGMYVMPDGSFEFSEIDLTQ